MNKFPTYNPDTSKAVTEEGQKQLSEIRKIIKENFNEDGTLKKRCPDIVIVDYMNKIK